MSQRPAQRPKISIQLAASDVAIPHIPLARGGVSSLAPPSSVVLWPRLRRGDYHNGAGEGSTSGLAVRKKTFRSASTFPDRAGGMPEKLDEKLDRLASGTQTRLIFSAGETPYRVIWQRNWLMCSRWCNCSAREGSSRSMRNIGGGLLKIYF